MVQPVEITSQEELKERIEAGGVIVVTRGQVAVPIAHRPEWVNLQQIRFPSRLARFWWTPDYPTAQATLGARRCRHCHWRSRSAPNRAARVYRP